MAQTASIVAAKLGEILAAPVSGLNAAVAGLAVNVGMDLPEVSAVIQRNAPVAVMERSLAVKYPVVHVYADRVQNLLLEKFRSFSGKIRAIAEVRVSQDRIDSVEEQTRLYVDGITQVLDGNRGSWGQGMFFTGGYEVKFEAVQQGGRNFLQVAKVVFEVDMSS